MLKDLSSLFTRTIPSIITSVSSFFACETWWRRGWGWLTRLFDYSTCDFLCICLGGCQGSGVRPGGGGRLIRRYIHCWRCCLCTGNKRYARSILLRHGPFFHNTLLSLHQPINVCLVRKSVWIKLFLWKIAADLIKFNKFYEFCIYTWISKCFVALQVLV